MSDLFFWIGAVLITGWFLLLFCGAALLVIGHRALATGDEEPDAEFASGYMAAFEPMRDAIATAHLETEPGGPSADLVHCWAIWPDAPLAAEQDGAS
jgi:hypothetical protein